MNKNDSLVEPLPFKAISNQIISVNKELGFRSFNTETDLNLLHNWVNQDYAQAFWQMRGSLGLLRSCYQCIMQNPYAHSFIGLYDGNPICQFDLYKVAVDELAALVNHDPQDCGFHLLMAPNQQPIHGLTQSLIQAFLDFYFSLESTGSMFAEPDAQNDKSIRLLENAGFQRIATVAMSYKTAHVYSLTKEQFLCNR